MNIKRFYKGSRKYLTVLTVLSITAAALLGACSAAEAPEATKARSRAVINSGDIVPEEEIRVAEYLQYYDQNFPEPQNESVGLDLRLGNNLLPAQGCMAWLQIGLQTKSAETEVIAPLNLAIVIDRSGSMRDDDKMPYVKQSLAVFLRSLNPDDIVSIVTYSDHAELLLPAQKVGDGRWIQEVINGIEPGGSTNLHAGMVLGLREVERNFNIHRNNRVMLLTDGIANQGEIDPVKIAADALRYNEKGIYLSTIGLGLEFNDSLLIKLADQGEGGYTFVDSAEEMDRVFREQVNSLKQRVVDEVSVQIFPADGVRLIGLTGYEGTPPAEGASVKLWPMSIEDCQVVLAQLQVSSGRSGSRALARIKLSYYDELARRTVTSEKQISGEMISSMAVYDPTWDLEILRNVTIQETAEGMREIDRLFDTAKYEQAWRIAVELERKITEVARLTSDEQMYKDAALMRKYQKTLSDAVFQTQGRQPYSADNDAATDSGRPYRGNEPDDELPKITIK